MRRMTPLVPATLPFWLIFQAWRLAPGHVGSMVRHVDQVECRMPGKDEFGMVWVILALFLKVMSSSFPGIVRFDGICGGHRSACHPKVEHQRSVPNPQVPKPFLGHTGIPMTCSMLRGHNQQPGPKFSSTIRRLKRAREPLGGAPKSAKKHRLASRNGATGSSLPSTEVVGPWRSDPGRPSLRKDASGKWVNQRLGRTTVGSDRGSDFTGGEELWAVSLGGFHQLEMGRSSLQFLKKSLEVVTRRL